MGLVQSIAPTCEPLTLATAKAHCKYEGEDENDLVLGYIQAAREYLEGITGRQLINATWTWTLDEFPDDETPLYFPRNPLFGVAQESRATPGTVEIGDIFDLLVGGEVMATFTATVATVANVTAGLTAAWNDSTHSSAASITASDETTYIKLLGDVKGVAFTVTGSTTDGGGNDTQTLTISTPTAALSAVNSIKYIDTAGANQIWSSAYYDVDTSSIVGRVMPAYGQTYPATRWDINAVTVRFVAGYGTSPADVPRNDQLFLQQAIACRFEHRGDDEIPHSWKRSMNTLLWQNRVEIV